MYKAARYAAVVIPAALRCRLRWWPTRGRQYAALRAMYEGKKKTEAGRLQEYLDVSKKLNGIQHSGKCPRLRQQRAREQKSQRRRQGCGKTCHRSPQRTPLERPEHPPSCAKYMILRHVLGGGSPRRVSYTLRRTELWEDRLRDSVHTGLCVLDAGIQKGNRFSIASFGIPWCLYACGFMHDDRSYLRRCSFHTRPPGAASRRSLGMLGEVCSMITSFVCLSVAVRMRRCLHSKPGRRYLLEVVPSRTNWRLRAVSTCAVAGAPGFML